MKFLCVALLCTLAIFTRINSLPSEGASEVESVRVKRETPPLDCSALPQELEQIKKEIKDTKGDIEKETNLLQNATAKVAYYQEKISKSTGTSLKLYQSMLTFYQNSQATIQAKLDALQQKLATLNARESAVEANLVGGCAISPNPPCGIFHPYDPINNPGAPSYNGFVGISYANGDKIYVGLGKAASCSNHFQAPCSFTITGAYSPSTGCKIPCGANEIIDEETSFYLEKNANLVWEPTNSYAISKVSNTLKILGPGFMFGRALVNGNLILGKIIFSNGKYFFEAVSSNDAVQLNTGFEVLTCKIPGICNQACPKPTTPSPSTTTIATTTTATTTTISSISPSTTPEPASAPKPTTTTKRPLNCPYNKMDITDANGRVKTACVVKVLQRNYEAEAYCARLGYDGLYNIESSSEMTNLSNFLLGVARGVWHIRGSSVPPTNFVGNCMTFASSATAGYVSFSPKLGNCDTRWWFVCQQR